MYMQKKEEIYIFVSMYDQLVLAGYFFFYLTTTMMKAVFALRKIWPNILFIIMLMIRVAMISASHKYNLFTLQALKRLSRQIIFSSLHSLPCHLLSGCYNHNKGYSKTKHIIT